MKRAWLLLKRSHDRAEVYAVGITYGEDPNPNSSKDSFCVFSFSSRVKSNHRYGYYQPQARSYIADIVKSNPDLTPETPYIAPAVLTMLKVTIGIAVQ